MDIDIPIYIKTTLGANVRAGTYTDVINISWDFFICRSAVLLGCLTWWSGKGELTPITVIAVVDKDCIINNAPDIDFGSKAMVGQFDAVTQSVNLSCTSTEGYKVWFTDGDNRQGGWRRMADGGGNYLQYQIYQADGVTIWDSTNKLLGIGTGTSQPLIYKAKVNPNQAEVPSGSYIDNISVVVEY